MSSVPPEPAGVSLRVAQGEKSLPTGLRLDHLPKLVVITGENGAGKTQLLELLARSHGALVQSQPHVRHFPGGPPPPQALIEGIQPPLQHGDTFFSSSKWTTVAAGQATSADVASAIEGFVRDGAGPDFQTSKPWWAAELSAKANLPLARLTSLTAVELQDLLTPALLWGKGLPQAARPLAFYFLAYRLFEQRLLSKQVDPGEWQSKIGPPPWETVNRVLRAASLPFEVLAPAPLDGVSLVGLPPYRFCLRDTSRQVEVEMEQLSSGEQVIMSMATWIFMAQATGRHYRLMLLDEPDAHLHPSMARRFIQVLQEVFVKERGAQVIISTHSPTTVALVPLESLFEIRRTGEPRLIPATSKSELIGALTEGFVVVHEGMHIVLCEGENDAPFYKVVWERLTEASSLERMPSILFIHGKGIDTVRNVVSGVRAGNLEHFHGLVDRDNGNKPSEGIVVIQRRSVDNYLYDPIILWALLNDDDCRVDVPGVNVGRGRAAASVSSLSTAQLQAVADHMLACIGTNLPNPQAAETERVEVRFTNGRVLQYPRWLLDRHKDDLLAATAATFPRATRKTNGNHKEMTRTFAAVDMVPGDLLATLKTILSSPLSDLAHQSTTKKSV